MKSGTFLVAVVAFGLGSAGAGGASANSAVLTPVVGSAGASVIAVQTTSSSIGVRGPGTRSREFAVPTGCTPAAVSEGVVALGGCGPYVLRLATGRVVKYRLPDGIDGFAPLAAGEWWIEATATRTVEAGGVPRSASFNLLLNWKSGRTILLDRGDPIGVARYADLDRESPARALCRPLRRLALDRSGSMQTRYGRVTKVGRWVLQETSTGTQLQRCGSKHVRRWGRDATVVLGHRHVAYFTDGAPRSGIEVRALETGRVTKIATPAARELHVSAGASRLIVSMRGPSLAWAWNTYPRLG